MSMKKVFIQGVVLFLLTLYFYGINWGVPEGKISSVVFGDGDLLEKLTPAMLDAHEEIRDMQIYYGAPYLSGYRQDKLEVAELNGSVEISKEAINACRSYLTRSAGADEQAVPASFSKMNPGKFDFDPKFYEYGGAYLYPMGLFLYGLSRFNVLTLNPDMSFYFLNPAEMGKMFVAGRIFGALGALFSVFVFFLVCREVFYDRMLAYFLALLYGVSPGLVMWSHYLKPFSYGMLWFLLSLWAVVKFYRTEKDKWLYTASVFAGLSFGTLLSYGYIYWAVVVFILFSGKGYIWKLKNLFLTFLIFLAVFFMTNPYVLISWSEFVLEMMYLRAYWHKDISINALWIFMSNTLRYGLGTMLWIVLFAGLAGSVAYKTKRADWLFLLLILPGFLYFAFTTAEWVHYSIFLYPFFIISAGFFLNRIGLKRVVIPLLAVVAAYTVLYSASYVKMLGEKNIRTVAGEWINENIYSGSSVGLLEAPSPWRTPPFKFLDYKLVISGEEHVIAGEAPEYFIVSEYQWLRGRGLPAVKELLSDYEVIEKFEKVPSIMGIKFRHQEVIPHDWCHPNPVILIWKRKA